MTRAFRRLGIVLSFVVISLAACATVPPEQAAREALMWEAARECQGRFVTIQSIDRIDNYGRIVFTYHGSGPENQAFLDCYEKLAGEKLKAAPVISSGRAVPPPDVGNTTVPLQTRAGQLLVEATFNRSVRAHLLLDTGATVTVVNPSLIQRLRLSVPLNATRWPVSLFGGTTVHMPFIRLESLGVGEFVVEAIDVGVYDAGPDAPEIEGVLGVNFLGHFRFTIDRANSRLSLER